MNDSFEKIDKIRLEIASLEKLNTILKIIGEYRYQDLYREQKDTLISLKLTVEENLIMLYQKYNVSANYNCMHPKWIVISNACQTGVCKCINCGKVNTLNIENNNNIIKGDYKKIHTSYILSRRKQENK